MTELRIGIDIGKRHDPSAIVVALAELRSVEAGGREITHYDVPFLKRLELDTSYPAQVEELTVLCRGAAKRFEESRHGDSPKQPDIFVDVTGVGDAVVDLLEPRLAGIGELHPCRFAGGDQIHEAGQGFRIGKGHFVSRLQVLAESRVIHLPPQLAEARQLSQELLDFDIDVDEMSGKATYGAIRPGTHDDMVTALGLACLQEAEAGFPRLVFGGGDKKCGWRESPARYVDRSLISPGLGLR